MERCGGGVIMQEDKLIYLGENILQQDLRIRIPKPVIVNLSLQPGKSKLQIFLNAATEELIIRSVPQEEEKND